MADGIPATRVKIWGEEVGAVIWREDRGCAAFEYEASFLKRGFDLSPVHMGVREALVSNYFEFPSIDKATFHGLPGLLANSLPDYFGNTIVNQWLRIQGRKPNSIFPVERLSYIGSKGMGALEYEPCLFGHKLEEAGPINIENLRELAQKAITTQTEININVLGSEREEEEAILDILRVCCSAGGAVPKAIVAMNDSGKMLSGQGTIPDGYIHYILKFDGVGDWNKCDIGQSIGETRVEYAYYLMAKEAGIAMMESKLLEENGHAHFLTQRFDRKGNNRIHTLNLACLGHLGWNPMGKVGYEDAFDLMRNLKLQYPDREEQYRRMIFNALSRNLDDHVKNISYTMTPDGKWRLSPAYDITCTYDPEGLVEGLHKMRINGKQQNLTYDDFLDVAEYAEINTAKEIIEEVTSAVQQWGRFAKEAGVTKDLAARIASYHLVEDIVSNSPKK